MRRAYTFAEQTFSEALQPDILSAVIATIYVILKLNNSWFLIIPPSCKKKCKGLSELHKPITTQSNFSKCHSGIYLTSHILFFAVYVTYKKYCGKNNAELQEKTDNEVESRSSFQETNKGFQPDEK